MNRIAFLVACAVVSACSGSNPEQQQAIGNLQADDLTGEYTMLHTVMHLGANDWEEAEVRDTLSISQQGDSTSFYLALVQTNYHICEMEGTGTRTSDGITTPPENIEFGGEVDVCRFRLVADADTIRLVDEGNICRRYYCGARAYLDGVAFPRR